MCGGGVDVFWRSNHRCREGAIGKARHWNVTREEYLEREKGKRVAGNWKDGENATGRRKREVGGSWKGKKKVDELISACGGSG